MTHTEETRNFLGDPLNDYCEMCLCSWHCSDDECTCECHETDNDWADGQDDL